MTIVRLTEDGFSFECPGCGDRHVVDTKSGWSWNGSRDKPSVTPSLDIRSGHFASHHKAGDECWCGKNYTFSCYHCHFVITDGVIHFANDCSHAMASKSVAMTEIA